MDLNKLKQEAEEWLNKWELCNKCQNKVDCVSNFSYCKNVVLQSYLASAEPREKHIAELEKENAELKGLKDVATLIRANNDTVTTLMQLNNMLVSRNQQLTKAKELLNEFKRVLKERNLYHNDLYKRTEQFLNEVEK
jgi:hypothetical protein